MTAECIYKLLDPRDNSIRYIGRTMYGQGRLHHHISVAKNGYTNKKKNAWIKEIIAEGFLPEMEIIEEVEKEQAASREAYWIFTLLAQGVPLLNDTSALPRSLKWEYRSLVTKKAIKKGHDHEQ